MSGPGAPDDDCALQPGERDGGVGALGAKHAREPSPSASQRKPGPQRLSAEQGSVHAPSRHMPVEHSPSLEHPSPTSPPIGAQIIEPPASRHWNPVGHGASAVHVEVHQRRSP